MKKGPLKEFLETLVAIALSEILLWMLLAGTFFLIWLFS